MFKFTVCALFVLLFVCTNEARIYRNRYGGGHRQPVRHVDRRTIIPARVTVAVTTNTTTTTTTTTTNTVTTTIKTTLMPGAMNSMVTTTKVTSVTLSNYLTASPAGMQPVGATVCGVINAPAGSTVNNIFAIVRSTSLITVTCVPSITCGVTTSTAG